MLPRDGYRQLCSAAIDGESDGCCRRAGDGCCSGGAGGGGGAVDGEEDVCGGGGGVRGRKGKEGGGRGGGRMTIWENICVGLSCSAEGEEGGHDGSSWAVDDHDADAAGVGG